MWLGRSVTFERNPTDGDPFDPSPNEHALYLIPMMGAWIVRHRTVNAGLL